VFSKLTGLYRALFFFLITSGINNCLGSKLLDVFIYLAQRNYKKKKSAKQANHNL
jgi:hypothetical protein